jgi:hypothetical protein
MMDVKCIYILQRRDDKSIEPDPFRMRFQRSANMATEAVPTKIPNDCNLSTETVPNEIPNNCDMTTKLVPNEIEYDHRTY